MTEDSRLGEIREAMSHFDKWEHDSAHRVVDSIRAILDSDACNCQAIPGTENYPGPWHVRGDAPHYPCANPAPRVWFPGDVVPAGVLTVDHRGSVTRCSFAQASNWVQVEVAGVPSPEEWQAVVDRARAEREES